MRVLLIEDDSATAQSIELMLKSESFNVYTTDLGEDGIDLGKVYDYDIILLDLTLPDMSPRWCSVRRGSIDWLPGWSSAGNSPTTASPVPAQVRRRNGQVGGAAPADPGPAPTAAGPA